jgi:trigger factor
MPEYYAQAVIEHDVDVVAPPEIEITGGQEDGPVQFDAVVEIRPSVSAAGYDGLRVEIPNPVASDERSTSRSTTCAATSPNCPSSSGPAADEDHVTIDIEATHGDEPVPGLDHHGLRLPPRFGRRRAEIDENLRGASLATRSSSPPTTRIPKKKSRCSSRSLSRR